jgi:hypothetical protein
MVENFQTYKEGEWIGPLVMMSSCLGLEGWFESCFKVLSWVQ